MTFALGVALFACVSGYAFFFGGGILECVSYLGLVIVLLRFHDSLLLRKIWDDTR